jgi:hypothetical protein
MAPHQHIQVIPIEDDSFEVGVAYPYEQGLQCIKHGAITETYTDTFGNAWCRDCWAERFRVPEIPDERE